MPNITEAGLPTIQEVDESGRAVDFIRPEEDRRFFREGMFATCQFWGYFDNHELVGIIAFREGWGHQLYVLPSLQGRGWRCARNWLEIVECSPSPKCMVTLKRADHLHFMTDFESRDQ